MLDILYSNNSEDKEIQNNFNIHHNLSIRHKRVVQELQNVVEKIYKEADKAMEIFNLEKSIYGFHQALHKITNLLYELEIFVFKNYCILVNSSINTKIEKELSYILECVHNRHICNLFYFLSKDIKNRIIENLQYITEIDNINKIIQNMYSKDNALKQYIFNLVKQQFYALLLTYKYHQYHNNLLFDNQILIVGLPKDIYELRKHFQKELNIIINNKNNNKFTTFKDFLISLLAYKIKLLSDSEICLILKIYCITNGTTIDSINTMSNEELLNNLINTFNNNKNFLYKSNDAKFMCFKNICDNKFNNSKFIFLNQEIKDKIINLSELEIDYLKKVLYNEIYSDNSSKYFYQSISEFGAYISNLINIEIDEFIKSNA